MKINKKYKYVGWYHLSMIRYKGYKDIAVARAITKAIREFLKEWSV